MTRSVIVCNGYKDREYIRLALIGEKMGHKVYLVMRGLLMSMVSNPVDALLNANYIGILVWAVGLGFALRHGNETTKNLVNDMSNAVTFMVKLVIRFAPIGIFGLVSSTLATTGFATLWGYAQLLTVLVGCMLLVAFVVNPLLVFWKIRRNVGGGAAGKESVHAAFAQTGQHQRIRVTANFPEPADTGYGEFSRRPAVG